MYDKCLCVQQNLPWDLLSLKSGSEVTGSVFVCKGYHNKMPQTKWLKQQNCTFSQFWRLEAQAQGVSRVGFFQGLFHWLPDDCLLAGSSCGHPCVHTWSLFLFLWGHQSDPIRAYPRGLNWASLVAQLVKNLPAMWDTWVLSLGLEDPLQKGKSTHSTILAWRIPSTV